MFLFSATSFFLGAGATVIVEFILLVACTFLVNKNENRLKKRTEQDEVLYNHHGIPTNVRVIKKVS
jgi:large-conductance mechanosensitive channel